MQQEMWDDKQIERRYCSRLGWALFLTLLLTLGWLYVLSGLDMLYTWDYISWDIRSILGNEEIYNLAATRGGYLVAIPVSFFICRRRYDQPALTKRAVSVRQIGCWFVSGIFLMVAGQMIGASVEKTLYHFLGQPPVDLVNEMLDQMSLWMIAADVCLLGPICEELLFRRLLANRLSRYGQKPAAIVSALLFGLYHANFGQFFYAFGLGILLAYAYFQTGRFWVPLLLHILFNIYGGLLPIIFEVDTTAMILYVVAELLLCIAGIIILIRDRSDGIWKHGFYPPQMRVIFGNPGMLFLIAALFIETALYYLFLLWV